MRPCGKEGEKKEAKKEVGEEKMTGYNKEEKKERIRQPVRGTKRFLKYRNLL